MATLYVTSKGKLGRPKTRPDHAERKLGGMDEPVSSGSVLKTDEIKRENAAAKDRPPILTVYMVLNVLYHGKCEQKLTNLAPESWYCINCKEHVCVIDQMFPFIMQKVDWLVAKATVVLDCPKPRNHVVTTWKRRKPCLKTDTSAEPAE